jgi:hypothetical protein
VTEPVSTTAAYTFGTTLSMPVASARPVVEAALKAEGFGVLTAVHVVATIKESRAPTSSLLFAPAKRRPRPPV